MDGTRCLNSVRKILLLFAYRLKLQLMNECIPSFTFLFVHEPFLFFSDQMQHLGHDIPKQKTNEASVFSLSMCHYMDIYLPVHLFYNFCTTYAQLLPYALLDILIFDGYAPQGKPAIVMPSRLEDCAST